VTAAMAYAFNQLSGTNRRSGTGDGGAGSEDETVDERMSRLKAEVYEDFSDFPVADINFIEFRSDLPWRHRGTCGRSFLGCYVGGNKVFVVYGSSSDNSIKVTIAHELLHVDESMTVSGGGLIRYTANQIWKYGGHNPSISAFDDAYHAYLGSTPRIPHPKPDLSQMPWRREE